jgi:hypothetical protein
MDSQMKSIRGPKRLLLRGKSFGEKIKIKIKKKKRRENK